MEYFREEIRRIMICVNMIDGIYAKGAKKIGIKYNTLALFYALDDGLPHSQKEICEQWLIPKTTINTIVRECMEAGYVILEPAGQMKEKEIRITERGREFAGPILSQFYEVERRAMERTLGGFSREFVEAVEHFTNYLKEEAGRLPLENRPYEQKRQ